MKKQTEQYRFDSPDVIDIKNMNLYYGDFQALKNINMEIPSRKVTAFIGPSGCGNPRS